MGTNTKEENNMNKRQLNKEIKDAARNIHFNGKDIIY